MLRKLSSGQGRPSKKHIFGHVFSLIVENVTAAYSENFLGLLHTPAKYEKNPPYGFEAIAKKMQIRRTHFSHIQTSIPHGTLNNPTQQGQLVVENNF